MSGNAEKAAWMVLKERSSLNVLAAPEMQTAIRFDNRDDELVVMPRYDPGLIWKKSVAVFVQNHVINRKRTTKLIKQNVRPINDLSPFSTRLNDMSDQQEAKV